MMEFVESLKPEELLVAVAALGLLVGGFVVWLVMRAKLVESESQIPMAMAEALRTGRLGVLDYYQMRNVAADTDMRQSISKLNEPPK